MTDLEISVEQWAEEKGIIQCRMQGVLLEECLQSAYDVISKRTGKIINGQFVKDGNTQN